MPGLNADAIARSDDSEASEVEVPEWGGSVYVRVLGGIERDEFITNILSIEEKSDARVAALRTLRRLAALTVCDEKGARLFPDTDEGETLLAKKSTKVVDRIAVAAMELNGLEKKGAEAIEADLGKTPS